MLLTIFVYFLPTLFLLVSAVGKIVRFILSSKPHAFWFIGLEGVWPGRGV
jgi:hypothetical protein